MRAVPSRGYGFATAAASVASARRSRRPPGERRSRREHDTDPQSRSRQVLRDRHRAHPRRIGLGRRASRETSRARSAPSPRRSTTPAQESRSPSSPRSPGCRCRERRTRPTRPSPTRPSATSSSPYISTNYTPSGSTDWEDAFRVGRYFLPRPNPNKPHLVVFITDGDPNEIIRDDQVTYNPGNTEYQPERVRAQGPARRHRGDLGRQRRRQGPGRSQRQRAQGPGLAHPDGGRRQRAQQRPIPGSHHRCLRPRRLLGHRHLQHRDRRRLPGAELRRPRGGDAAGGVPTLRSVDHGAQAARPDPRPEHAERPRPGRRLGHDGDCHANAGHLGAAADRNRQHGDDDDRRLRVRPVPMDDDGAGQLDLPDQRGGSGRRPAGVRKRSIGHPVHLPNPRAPRRPAPSRERDQRCVFRDGLRPGDRHLPDGQPRAAPSADRRSRNRPTAPTPTTRRGRPSR